MPGKQDLQFHLSTLMAVAFAIGFCMFANWIFFGMKSALGSGMGAFPMLVINAFVLFPLSLFIMGFTKLLCDHLSSDKKDQDASSPGPEDDSGMPH